jgi:hypothetical protein
VLPLAPLTAVEPEQVPTIIRRIDERFRQEASPGDADILRAATLLMLGLRYSRDQIRNLRREMAWWHESSVYIDTVEEGRFAEVRRLILSLGTQKFGTPDADIVSTLEHTDDLDLLERMHDRILRASSWQELFAADTGA